MMNFSGFARYLMYLLGYDRWKLRRTLGLKEIKLGNVLFTFENPGNITIRAKAIGSGRPAAEPVSLQQKGSATILMEEGTVLRRGVSLSAHGSGAIRIRQGTTIGKGTSFETYGAAGIDIGANCRISWHCVFLSTDKHIVIEDGNDTAFESDVIIGDHVWIGTRALILKGTVIGENSIVAAGSVCSGTYPANALIAGVPAKILKSGMNWRHLSQSERLGLSENSS